METWQEETPLFSAPLVPGPNSWVKTYYQLTLLITPFLFLGVLFFFVLGWAHISLTWLGIWLVLLPVSTILIHFIAVKWLAKLDIRQRNSHKIHVGKDFLTLFHPTGEVERFAIEPLIQIRWVYSGYERAWRKNGPYFSGHNNQLSFQYRDQKTSVQFRLVSKTHFREFRRLLATWYEAGHTFEEFNQTSGLPLESHLLVS